jgi:uncharacterized membrane protein
MEVNRLRHAMSADSEKLGPNLTAIPALAVRALWCVVALLVVVGVGSAVGRSVFRADFARRADPARQQVLAAFHRTDPLLAERPKELDRFDSRFAAHPLATLLHVLPGGIFLILAPLQFSARIRRRHIRFHRWSGRFLALAGFAAGLAGLYFGLLMPYGGLGEASAITFFGGLFVFSVVRAVVAIRRHQVARHREWMIRAFSIAIGISTVRIVAAVLDLALSPAGLRPPDLFALSLWMGWAITLGAGELWIRYTRGMRTDAVGIGFARHAGAPSRVGR